MTTQHNPLRHIRIIGSGSYLPGAPVSNQDLVDRGIDTTDEWIQSRSGIAARHFAEQGAKTSTLAFQAAQNALADANITADTLDMIIVATSTPDMIFPSTACLLQQQLGNTTAAAFDVQAVCCGFIYAATIAEKFLHSGSHRRILVVGAEIFSRILDWQDRSTCVLFGDGAGAVIFEAVDDTASDILATAIHANGQEQKILNVPGQINQGQVIGDPFLRMDGQAVFKLAIRVLSEVAEECCQIAATSLTSIDWVIPHQANIRIILATAKKLGVAPEKMLVSVSRHGNTSAASIPLALDEAIRSGKIQRGQRLLMAGVGGGFTWGGLLLDY